MTAVREVLGRRLRRWRSTALPIAQAGLAASLAWFVAAHVVEHRLPYFAPVAAVICLGVTLGQRVRRGLEMVAGVSIGIGIGDLLISATGTGSWQIGVLVILAMSVATLLDDGPVITMQSAVSAVLVATLYAPAQATGSSRMVDALIGGAVGLTVAALLPADPVAVVQRHADRVLGAIAGALRDAATAIEAGDAGQTAMALGRARGGQRLVDAFQTALEIGEEITTIAPIRWHRRPQLERYRRVAPPADQALRDIQVLARRAGTALRAAETIPPALPRALDDLAAAVDLLATELAVGNEPLEARRRLERVARSMGAELVGAGDLSTWVVLAQLRSTAVDLLQATGMTRGAARILLPVLDRPSLRVEPMNPIRGLSTSEG